MTIRTTAVDRWETPRDGLLLILAADVPPKAR
jgi:hypothetical protein